MSERELDALTWREFFMRPGERQMDAEGYWSARMGVRMVFPRYATDAAAMARIEAELTRRSLRQEYDQALRRYGAAQSQTPVQDVATDASVSSVSLDQRRRAALQVALAHRA